MNPYTFRKAASVRTSGTGKKSLIDTFKDAGSAALHKRLHPAITLSFSLFAAVAFGSGVMYQISSEPVPVTGKVLGDSVVVNEVPLVNNSSLKLSVQPLAASAGAYPYSISWTRSKDAAGSLYVTPYENSKESTFLVSPTTRNGRVSTGAVFKPGSRYRIEFYKGAGKTGGLLARKFFVVPSLQTPVAVCDYAAPPTGCVYVQGARYVSSTGCGLELQKVGGGVCGSGGTATGISDQSGTSLPSYRYIKVNTPVSRSWVSWAEIEIYGADGKKITPVKASASTVWANYPGSQDGHTANLVYDGKTDTAWNAGETAANCSWFGSNQRSGCGIGGQSGYIELDLGKAYPVSSVRMYTQNMPSPAQAVHQLLGRGESGDYQKLYEFSGQIDTNTWLEYPKK